MKRCIVCGNVGSDDSVVCDVCGNPYIDMEETPETADAVEAADKLEEQLKEVWKKVQEDEPDAELSAEPVSGPTSEPVAEQPAAEEDSSQPELTVVSENSEP